MSIRPTDKNQEPMINLKFYDLYETTFFRIKSLCPTFIMIFKHQRQVLQHGEDLVF